MEEEELKNDIEKRIEEVEESTEGGHSDTEAAARIVQDAAPSLEQESPPPAPAVPAPGPTAEECKNRGNELYRQKCYKESIEWYSKAIDKEPSNAIYYGNRSAAYLMLKNYESCLEDSLKSIELDDSYVKGYHRAMEIYILNGDYSNAEKILERHVSHDPKSKVAASDKQVLSRCTTRLVRLKELLKDTSASSGSRAENLIQEILTASPNSVELKLLAIDIYMKQRNLDEALGITTSLMRAGNQSNAVLVKRAEVLYMQDQLQQAIQIYSILLQNDPDNGQYVKTIKKMKRLDALKKEGNKLFQSGKYDDAIAKYSECLEIDPENKLFNAKLFCNRAQAKMKSRKAENALQNALSDFELALQYGFQHLSLPYRCDPDYGKAYYRKAQCLIKLGGEANLEESLTCLEKAGEMCSDLRETIQEEMRDAKRALKAAKRKDYYKILGVTRDVEETELKKAYRKLALIWHPDRHSSESPEEVKQAEIKFKEIGEAYAVLSDPDKRRRYDSGQDLETLDHDDFGGMGEGIDPMSIFAQMFANGGGGMGGMGGFPGGVRFQTSDGGGGRRGHGGFPGGFPFSF